MNPQDLTVVTPTTEVDEQALEQVAEKLTAEYRAHKARYDRFQALRESAENTGATVRRAALWTVGSIKTDTQLVDDGASEILAGDFGDDRAFLLSTEHGSVKWDRYGEWFSSDVPDRVAELLDEGRVDDAHALLSGRDPETGERVGEYYLRACKASLVLYLLGYDRVCLDTRIYRAVKPAIRALFEDDVVTHPETETENPYRASTPRMDAGYTPIYSHSGDEKFTGEKSYWEDKLKWNVIQYDAMTTHLRDRLAEKADVPADLLPQVAFNTQGETTIHADLMERIQ